MAALATGNDNIGPSTKRVSYVLPLIQTLPPLLRLPSLEANLGNIRGRSGPYLVASTVDTNKTPTKTRFHSDTERDNAAAAAAAAATHPRHVLPVSSLAIDTSTVLQGSQDCTPTGILYTGGRDGMIGAWELGLPLKRRKLNSRYSMEKGGDEVDEELESTTGLLEEVSSLGQDRSFTHNWAGQWQVDTLAAEEAPPAPAAKFRQCLGSHTDWINDLVLCNQNQTVLSASSDRTIKIWNPHDPTSSMMPQTLGTHMDYVRALSLSPKCNWVASGSFDKTIKVWDLKELRHDPILTITEPQLQTSIYALAVDEYGGIMAAASPEKMIQLWDPRSGQRISQLVGHRDNVRNVVLSRDGRHLLSASSDSTIRLWSMAEQRCLHTFTHHNDSVWSLFSTHESLDVFYSGDRSGVVCKVDWERCNEVSEGECVVLAKEKCKEGRSKFNRGCPQDSKAAGIYKIVALDDAYIWTANSDSVVSRWKGVAPRSRREALYPISSRSYTAQTDYSAKQGRRMSSLVSSPLPSTRPSAFKSHTSSSNVIPTSVSFAEHTTIDTPHSELSQQAATGGGGGGGASASGRTEMCEEKEGRAATLYGLPFDSLVCLAPPNDPYGAAIGLGSISIRTLDRRDSATNQSSAHAMFSSASLISIPSVLRATASSSSHHESFSPYSPLMDPSSSSPATINNNNIAATSPHHNRHHLNSAATISAAAARPSSTRSASIRFAPLTTAYNRPENEGVNQGDSFQDYDEMNNQIVGEDDEAHDARQAFEERDSALDATPLRSQADDVIVGAHGLIRCTLLNDRRHVLAIDSAGQIFLWDIVAAQCLGMFAWSEVVQAWSEIDNATKEEHLFPGDALDIVKERIQGEGVTPMWCSVDTRIGSLSIHFDYPRCFDAEIYLDEMANLLDLYSPQIDYKEDQRVNVARLVLRNLFDGFIRQEAKLRSGGKLRRGQLAIERSKELGKKPDLKIDLTKKSLEHIPEKVQTPGMTVALAVAAKTPAILPIASPLSPLLKLDMSGLQQLLTAKHTTSTEEQPAGQNIDDYFSLLKSGAGAAATDSKPQTPQSKISTTSAITSPTSPGGGGSGLMGRLRMSLKRGDSKREDKSTIPSRVESPGLVNGGSEEEVNGKSVSNEKKLILENVRRIMASADPSRVIEEIPGIPFPPQTAIMISEASTDSINFHIDYLGLVKSTDADVANLEVALPSWLLEYLVGASDHSPPLKEKDKLTFLLVPWQDTRPKSASLTDQLKTMPEMPTNNSRLTATKMLRVKKACIYIADKLNLVNPDKVKSSANSIIASRRNSTDPSNGTSPRKPFNSTETSSNGALEPHESIELLCNGVILPIHCTLAQIQRFYWKSSSILKLEYRWREQR